MKVKMMVAVLLAAFFVGSTVNAAYVVYKTKNQIQPYSLTGANWGKDAKLTVETYTVFEVIAGAVDPTDTPQRIVIFKPAKGEAAYDVTSGKKITKLLMDPRTPAEYDYTGSIATKYLPYSGDWDVSVANSTTNKSYMFLYSYAVETAGDPIDRYGEQYSGAVKAFTTASGAVAAAPTLKGALTYVSGDLPLIPEAAGEDLGKGSLKYDKASTAVAAAQGTMVAAVGTVVTYLEGKGYNATWSDTP